MKTVGVSGIRDYGCWRPTFDALGAAFGVTFEERTFGDERCVDAWLVLDADRNLLAEHAVSRPCYVVLHANELRRAASSSKLTFASRPDVLGVLAGRDISADDVPDANTLPGWLGDATPLAFKDGEPVWAIHHGSGRRCHYVALPPPQLKPDEPLFAHLGAKRMARLLPLIVFLRSLTDAGWQPPPLQASFMFDDPNLHWTSYGFIDYRQMVKQALAGRYHVSVATIPLDAWLVHPKARAIFKQHSDVLSLLFHGNDHVSDELGRPISAQATSEMLTQALTRIARMESRTGLEVARVMAPPHGACSEATIAGMARLGFEAVCVSRGSLHYHNPGAAWLQTVGMKPCDIVRGLPVIPRFGLSRNCTNDILIAALLAQPIVPMTHHQMVAEGYQVLDDTASLIHSLGPVRWHDMQSISRSLYAQQLGNGTLSIRMFSRMITVPVPFGVKEVRIVTESPTPLFWRRSNHSAWNAAPPDVIPAEPGTTVEIASMTPEPQQHGMGRRRLKPVARRLLTAGRDRMLPSIHRLARVRRSTSFV